MTDALKSLENLTLKPRPRQMANTALFRALIGQNNFPSMTRMSCVFIECTLSM